MAAKYRKIDPRIWNDEKFRRCDANQKLVILELITGQSNRCGLFCYSPALGAERLGWTPDFWLETARTACAIMEWPLDESERCVLVPKWWRYNCPNNRNLLKGCLRDLEDLPKTALIRRYHETGQQLSPALREFFDTIFLRTSYTLRNQGRTQDQEQDQEQEQEPLTPQSGVPDSLRARNPSPRALGTNPRAVAAKAKAAEIKRRARLLAVVRRHGEKTLADGRELQSVGLYQKATGLLTWDRVSTEILETLATELKEK